MGLAWLENVIHITPTGGRLVWRMDSDRGHATKRHSRVSGFALLGRVSFMSLNFADHRREQARRMLQSFDHLDPSFFAGVQYYYVMSIAGNQNTGKSEH